MTVKDEVRKMLDTIPDTATWDDIMYTFYVRQQVSEGVRDAEEGRVYSQEEAKARLLNHAR